MARVPLVAPEEASAVVQAAYAEVARKRGNVLHLFRAMAHTPELMRRVSGVGEYLRFESVLPARLREIVTLSVAGQWACAYEAAQHGPLATRLGVDDATRAALAAGDVPASLEPLEAAAVRWALALVRDGRADAALLAPLQAAWGDEGVVELTLQVGYYSMIALFLNGLEVDIDAPRAP